MDEILKPGCFDHVTTRTKWRNEQFLVLTIAETQICFACVCDRDDSMRVNCLYLCIVVWVYVCMRVHGFGETGIVIVELDRCVYFRLERTLRGKGESLTESTRATTRLVQRRFTKFWP